MLSHTTLVFSTILTVAWTTEDLSFPPGMKFGVASAAYQVEGAWNVSDKGESIWDRFSHRTPSPIADGSSGDVACDSYHLWKEDINMVAELGAQFYRISIAWARLLPNGFPYKISEDGKNYYSNLIDGLLEKGIEPVVTLYHWDLPQRLQDLEGGWPPVIEETIANISREEGYPWSMLPALTKKEIDLMKGTYDFYALNLYTSRLIRRARPGEKLRPWPIGDAPMFHAKMETHPDWPASMRYFSLHPEGIRKQLVWLKKHYGDIPFFIMENGRGTTEGLHDQDRIDYYRSYLKQVLLAIKEDGVNVTGYTAWTVMDNFEWNEGYKIRFGLYEVNFTSPLRTRIPRASAKYYASIIKSHSLDVPYNFTAEVITKSSQPQENQKQNLYIIFGGIVMVLIVVAIATLVVIRVKRRAKMEKEHRYTAVNNGNQDGTRNDAQNGTRNGAQNGTRHGAQNGTRNGA